MELCTPTGAALLTGNATSFGPQPAMAVAGSAWAPAAGTPRATRTCCGCWSGTRSSPTGDAAPHGTNSPLLVETNIDDLDPRLWPNVIASLLDAGA